MKIFEVAIAAVALSVATSCDAGPSGKAETANAPVASATAPASETALDRLLDTELVGGNLAYFEAISGPAKSVWDWREGQSYREYEVEGCDISLRTQAQTINAITLTITPQCNPGGFGMQFAGKTLGEAAADLGSGRYVAGCISFCGNAVEPTHAFQVSGYRANGFLNYSIEATTTTDGDWDRLHAWKDRMIASHGEDYVLIDMTYQCSDADAEGARLATQGLQIISVTVSRDDESLICD